MSPHQTNSRGESMETKVFGTLAPTSRTRPPQGQQSPSALTWGKDTRQNEDPFFNVPTATFSEVRGNEQK